MFVAALRRAAAFTYPYVGLRRDRDGEVYSVVGAFVVLNRDGWIVTSAHIVQEILGLDGGGPVGAEQHADPSPSPHTELWALPRFTEVRTQLTTVHVNRVSDLAVARLEPFEATSVPGFPVLRNARSAPIEQGESVCRLGFPFHTVHATYSQETDEFDIDAGAFPVPRFALDGIVSRFNVHREPGGSAATFIETSTPGLRGQSGGPLLDVVGRVCGIQSHTVHLDLGFDAQYTSPGAAGGVERQFLNVGAAAHVDELLALLDDKGIAYEAG